MKINHSTFGLIVIALSVMFLNGCASNGLKAYHKDQSRAWNISHSVGMNQLDDARVPKDQLPNQLLATASSGIDVAYFMSSQTLNMGFGNAFGLGLIGFLAKPAAQGERSTILAWVPADEVNSREEASKWVNDSFRNATLNAMENLDIKGEVKFHNKEVSQLLAGDYLETKISGVKPDGSKCGAYFRTYPENTSEKTPIPDFILPNTDGYRIEAGGNPEYPHVAIYCLGDSLDPYVQFVSEISKRLPPSVFIYTRQEKYNGNKIPPMIYDHGEALLFITAED